VNMIVCIRGLVLAVLASALPALELHGELRAPGQAGLAPFWARLGVAEARFAGKRLMELVYTPPPAASLRGTVLLDCPFLLLDDAGRVRAYNGRSSLNRAEAVDGRWRVVREVQTGDQIASVEDQVVGGPGFDRQLIALHLALVWRPGASGEAEVVDPFGGQPTTRVRWQDGTATWGDETLRITSIDGHLATLLDRSGAPLIVIRGFTP